MWFEFYYKHRKKLVISFILMSILSVTSLPYLKFAFNFEQFFPVGDEDLEYFQEFISEFESDDNFLLIALKHEPSIFDTAFLHTLKAFTDECEKVSYVKNVQSLSTFRYPIITPLGPRSLSAVHLNDPSQLEKDSIRLLSDERIVYNLINKSGDATVVILKTVENTQIEECKQIIGDVEAIILKYGIEKYHMLGRAYFQTELSELQFQEILLSTIVSGFLVSLVMILIFRRWRSILIALLSIGVGLLIFLGILSLLGRELTIMAALYPILMLIVGTSDVVHIMTKYFDELKKGLDRKEAIRITISQIGMATLLTSMTTAAGFATLLTSRIVPIKEFGINSAIGVVIAYIVVIGLTCPLMTYFKKEDLVPASSKNQFWNKLLEGCYKFTLYNTRKIVIVSIIFVLACLYGVTKIHTNYNLSTNLPKGAKITEDFNFFENQFAGFRPLELAGYLQNNNSYLDYDVMNAIAITDNYVKNQPEINTSISPATFAKSLNQALHNNDNSYYTMPDSLFYNRSRSVLELLSNTSDNMLLNKNKDIIRISSRVKDVGADNIKILSRRIDDWIYSNVDSSLIKFKQTGTGLILDKNSEFVRESLLYGLGLALVIVSVLMGLLFRDLKVLFIALIPNLLPLLFAAALIGYLGIALEAGVSIVFAIIFGIAVDDTIHFLSKYKLAKTQYKDREKALLVTFQETGKAIVFTSIILFFGFMIMLFSANLPSVVIGLLISVTLFSAVIADLIILPVVLRWFDI